MGNANKDDASLVEGGEMGMRLLIGILLTCAAALAVVALWIRDLDFLYAASPFLVAAYFATFRREELR